MIEPTTVEFAGGKGVRLAADRWLPRTDVRGTILLLHGGGQTRHSWRRTAERLAGEGWLTVSLDARGHGDSEWSNDYSLDAFVDDLHLASIFRLGGRDRVGSSN